MSDNDDGPDGMLAAAIAVQKGEWPHTMDARVWAEEFNVMMANQGWQPLDSGLLIGWFANAIMAGFDTANMQNADAIRAATADARAGWVLVPVKPTPLMLDAPTRLTSTDCAARIYRAMLAAAPRPDR